MMACVWPMLSWRIWRFVSPDWIAPNRTLMPFSASRSIPTPTAVPSAVARVEIRPMPLSILDRSPLTRPAPFSNGRVSRSRDASSLAMSPKGIRRPSEPRHLLVLLRELAALQAAVAELGKELEAPSGDLVIGPVTTVWIVEIEDGFEGFGRFGDPFVAGDVG